MKVADLSPMKVYQFTLIIQQHNVLLKDIPDWLRKAGVPRLKLKSGYFPWWLTWWRKSGYFPWWLTW